MLLSCSTFIRAIDTSPNDISLTMSSAGHLAQRQIAQSHRGIVNFAASNNDCFNQPDCPDGPFEIANTQAETTIAVNENGKHIVVGYNDFRGFGNAVVSVSGFSYSDDGGKTFTDGGQLPTPGNITVGGTKYPEVFGDPDVKHLTGCTFVYSSLGVVGYGTGLAQTVVLHRSRDCGHTWEGPFEVAAATNPNGLIDVNGNALDAADKELMDVDPETLRVEICWTDFTPVSTGREISCTHTDDVLGPDAPTFSKRVVVAARAQDGQGSSVKFFGKGSNAAVIAWTTFPASYLNGISYSVSSDKGDTWSAPRNLTTDFLTVDQVLGDDRVNTNPAAAVDTSSGPFKNNVYIVYANNDSGDGADVMMQRSTDGGKTFSRARAINRAPGQDREQWFPYVTVDQNTGRVYVFYYDQGVAASGDRTQVAYTFSDDGGVTWSTQAELSNRTFKAGWGNDTSQPNLGDYNQAVAQHGTLYAAFAITQQKGFTDGQPSASMNTPDVDVEIRGAREIAADIAAASAHAPEKQSADESEDASDPHRTFKTLLYETFDTVAPGSLPAGWTAAHGAGANVIPWTTSKSFAPGICGASNAAFHQNANDSTTKDQARWERLFSPRMTVPASAKFVSVDFDVCYDTEDDPILNVLAYDGLFLRLTDLTPGRTLRSVLAEAFEHRFTTGDFKHYPKHLPRNSDPAYFQDMSAWAGFSNGPQHVHMVFPGMAGSVFQLRFEYTQDQAGICSDLRPGDACGVTVDNVLVQSIESGGPAESTSATE
ncbi:MAG: exo-alpha-sialidase [Acidobacteriaceae bacterium]|nr:exo-alpha-sialidase [Acidobacteriaceae bacterium]